MLIFNEFQKNILNKYFYNDKDTGSTEIQIILITIKIKKLETHLKKNIKDHSNMRGYKIILNKRLKLLKYLKKKNIVNYNKITEDLKRI